MNAEQSNDSRSYRGDGRRKKTQRTPEFNAGAEKDDRISISGDPIYGGLEVLGQAVESAALASTRRESVELLSSEEDIVTLQRQKISGTTGVSGTDGAVSSFAHEISPQSINGERGQTGRVVLDPRGTFLAECVATAHRTMTNDKGRIPNSNFSVAPGSHPGAEYGPGMTLDGRDDSALASEIARVSGHLIHQWDEGSSNTAPSGQMDQEGVSNGRGDVTRPSKRRRKLSLRPPDFEPEVNNGGKIRNRYSLDFKVKVARYALSKDPNGRAKGGTVGPRYAAAQLGIPEAQSVREWIRRLPDMEEALAEAEVKGGASRTQHVKRKKSVSNGRAPLVLGIEAQLLSFVESVKKRGEVPVSSRLVREKARELQPGIFGEILKGDALAIRKDENRINSWCHRFLRRHDLMDHGEKSGGPRRRLTTTTTSTATVLVGSASGGSETTLALAGAGSREGSSSAADSLPQSSLPGRNRDLLLHESSSSCAVPVLRSFDTPCPASCNTPAAALVATIASTAPFATSNLPAPIASSLVAIPTPSVSQEEARSLAVATIRAPRSMAGGGTVPSCAPMPGAGRRQDVRCVDVAHGEGVMTTEAAQADRAPVEVVPIDDNAGYCAS